MGGACAFPAPLIFVALVAVAQICSTWNDSENSRKQPSGWPFWSAAGGLRFREGGGGDLMFTIARLAAAAMLLAALGKNAYDFYTIMRWAVCGVFSYGAYIEFERKRQAWGCLFVVMAVAFNPIALVHSDPHAVTVAGCEQRRAEHSSRPSLVGRELVRGHHGARFRAQQAHTVYLSTTKEDAREGKIVVHRRPETVTSRLEGHVVRPFRARVPARRRRQGWQLALGIEPAEARAATSLLSRNDETRVAHAQRPEDAPLEDGTERDIFETRDEETKQVGRQSVVKASPRLIDQRQGAESCDPLIRAEGVVDLASEGFGAGTRGPR